MRRSLALLSIFFLVSSSVRPAAAATIKIPDKIRVVIAEDLSVLHLSIKGEYTLSTIETGQVLKTGRTSYNINVVPTRYGIKFADQYLKIYGIHIIPSKEPAIYIGKRLYRGSLQIIKTKDGHLRAINVVDLEDYLKGVLYHEVSHRWPMETIKAQAIVSRTFALYQAQQNKDNYYYLKADTSSQVYGGVYAEKYRTNKAVDETNGEVLVYKGNILPAFFHATCGGNTEDSSILWNVDMPPLKGVKCPYCINSPHFSWERSISLEEIEKSLKALGHRISGITDIEIAERDRSQRVKQLIIRPSSGKVKISGKDFRQALGPALLKSTNFTASVKGAEALFKGKGWGHGVGMCQWGAFVMAKKRIKAEDIAEYYYPGANVTKLE